MNVKQDLRQVLDFLQAVKMNNNVEWMHANRPKYEAARDLFYALTVEVLARLVQIDPTLRGLDPKNCIFRFARDTRFSWDKRPYKEHFAAYFVPGGKKTVGAGYYLHLEPGGESMLCVGVHCPPTKALKLIRQEIYDNGAALQAIIDQPELKRLYPHLEGESLKVLPKALCGSPYDALIKMKSFDLWQHYTDDQILRKDFLDTVIEAFRVARPFNEYFNRVLCDTRISSIF